MHNDNLNLFRSLIHRRRRVHTFCWVYLLNCWPSCWRHWGTCKCGTAYWLYGLRPLRIPQRIRCKCLSWCLRSHQITPCPRRCLSRHRCGCGRSCAQGDSCSGCCPRIRRNRDRRYAWLRTWCLPPTIIHRGRRDSNRNRGPCHIPCVNCGRSNGRWGHRGGFTRCWCFSGDKRRG